MRRQPESDVRFSAVANNAVFQPRPPRGSRKGVGQATVRIPQVSEEPSDGNGPLVWYIFPSR